MSLLTEFFGVGAIPPAVNSSKFGEVGSNWFWNSAILTADKSDVYSRARAFPVLGSDTDQLDMYAIGAGGTDDFISRATKVDQGSIWSSTYNTMSIAEDGILASYYDTSDDKVYFIAKNRASPTSIRFFEVVVAGGAVTELATLGVVASIGAKDFCFLDRAGGEGSGNLQAYISTVPGGAAGVTWFDFTAAGGSVTTGTLQVTDSGGSILQDVMKIVYISLDKKVIVADIDRSIDNFNPGWSSYAIMRGGAYRFVRIPLESDNIWNTFTGLDMAGGDVFIYRTQISGSANTPVTQGYNIKDRTSFDRFLNAYATEEKMPAGIAAQLNP